MQPRNSFALYTEKARVQSKKWSDRDIEMVQYMFDRVSNYLHNQTMKSFQYMLEKSNADYLQATNTAKENFDFFSHMSHELRTPFHGVMSSLQILSSGEGVLSDSDRQRVVESALESGKIMLSTLDDILSLSKSKHNTESVKLPVHIHKLVHSTEKIIGPMAINKGVHFQVSLVAFDIQPLSTTSCYITNSDVDWESLVVLADESRILQIANNLTNNAIKFTNIEGSVSLTAYILHQSKVRILWDDICSQYENNFDACINISGNDETQLRYVFTVKDSGFGVDAVNLRLMFEAYKQVSTESKRTYQGN